MVKALREQGVDEPIKQVLTTLFDRPRARTGTSKPNSSNSSGVPNKVTHSAHSCSTRSCSPQPLCYRHQTSGAETITQSDSSNTIGKRTSPTSSSQINYILFVSGALKHTAARQTDCNCTSRTQNTSAARLRKTDETRQ